MHAILCTATTNEILIKSNIESFVYNKNLSALANYVTVKPMKKSLHGANVKWFSGKL